MPYDDRQRLESARATRQLVLEAAKASFRSRGFGGTSSRVYDVALVGDDEEVPLAGGLADLIHDVVFVDDPT